MSELSHLKNSLLAEQVQEEIYKYILKTPVNVGSKLPNEFELGRMFGAGRSTVREAVKLLSSRGIVEVRQGSGTYVINTTPVDLDPLGLTALEDKMSLALDLAELRLILEPGIAQMAALNATDGDISKLKELCDKVEYQIRNDMPYIENDIAFHTCIAMCSKNKVVEQLIPIIDTAVMMFVNVTHKQLTEETIMTHRNVTDAIASHDSIGAMSAMNMHLTFNRNAIKKLIAEQKNV